MNFKLQQERPCINIAMYADHAPLPVLDLLIILDQP